MNSLSQCSNRLRATQPYGTRQTQANNWLSVNFIRELIRWRLPRDLCGIAGRRADWPTPDTVGIDERESLSDYALIGYVQIQAKTRTTLVFFISYDRAGGLRTYRTGITISPSV